MTQLQRTTMSLLTFMPMFAFAHGEDVLETLYIEVASLVIFIIFVLSCKLNLRSKFILTAIYLLSILAIFMLTLDWPYRENRQIINILTGVVPALSVFIGLLLLKAQHKRWEK